MRFILYPLLAISAVAMTLAAVLLSPVIALFIDKEGILPRWLKWFQPSDNPAIGDAPWKAEHPTASNWWLAVTYMVRNPAQGFDQVLQANITSATPFKVYGNINTKDGDNGVAGWYLITANGYFHFSYIIDLHNGKCMTGGFGWRLISLAKRYKHPTLGQFVFTPMRFYRFSTAEMG